MTLHHLLHCLGILEAMESLRDSRFQVVHSPKTFKRGNKDSTVEHEQERLKLHVANQLRLIVNRVFGIWPIVNLDAAGWRFSWRR